MFIDEYLNELCAQLQVDPLRRDEIRLEIHTHLRERAEGWMRKGLAEDAAERRATEEFGEASEVAARWNLIPVPRSFQGHNRHVHILGGIFTALGIYCVYYFVQEHYFLYQEGFHYLPNQFFHSLLWFIPNLIALFLGIALLLRRQWARSGSLVYVSYLFLDCLSAPFRGAEFNLNYVVGFQISSYMCAYAFWVFLSSHRRSIAWN